MNFYKLISISRKIKSDNLKLFGVYILHILGKRHLSIRIDPSFNCNLSCRMCYFSTPEYRQNNNGIIPEQDFEHIARVLFPRALQVYIGCGAEPTTHRKYIKLIELAKQYKVPHIGIVSNGQLITDDQIKRIILTGTNELTLSCHGLTKDTFEYFMRNARFDQFISLLKKINKYKKELNSSRPEIRINYTVNQKNLSELRNFMDIIGPHHISSLQIRPVLNIGGSYSESITESQISEYNEIINCLKNECSKRNIRLLANKTDIKYQKKNSNKKVTEAVYCYIGPKTANKLNFDWKSISFSDFTKKTQWSKKVVKMFFNDKQSSINEAAGNYDVFE